MSRSPSPDQRDLLTAFSHRVETFLDMTMPTSDERPVRSSDAETDVMHTVANAGLQAPMLANAVAIDTAAVTDTAAGYADEAIRTKVHCDQSTIPDEPAVGDRMSPDGAYAGSSTSETDEESEEEEIDARPASCGPPPSTEAGQGATNAMTELGMLVEHVLDTVLTVSST